ncbi:MAG UNVERIFIED_CONTAM: hypothetical protein LVR18_19830 [Planctomycetaceae bacterium]|jgi:hypothetical protein
MTDWLSNLWTLMDRYSECQHFSVFRDWIPEDAAETLLAKWLPAAGRGIRRHLPGLQPAGGRLHGD